MLNYIDTNFIIMALVLLAFVGLAILLKKYNFKFWAEGEIALDIFEGLAKTEHDKAIIMFIRELYKDVEELDSNEKQLTEEDITKIIEEAEREVMAKFNIKDEELDTELIEKIVRLLFKNNIV